MSAPDRAVEGAAARLDALASRAAEKGGPVAKVAPTLQEDADFLHKMTPSKVRRRVRSPQAVESRRRKRRPARPSGGLAAVGAAFVLGVLVAKLVDWRSYAE
jgi:hypothetical protein